MKPQSTDSPLEIPSDSGGGHSRELLRTIPRAEGRSRLGIGATLPFSGVDLWNSYELSWLNARGKPVAATGEFSFPATSPGLIESKSLKLYLNSFSGTRYASMDAVRSILQRDLTDASGAQAEVRIHDVATAEPGAPSHLPGRCIDGLGVEISVYDLDPTLLSDSTEGDDPVVEALHSNLFKSNCPVTGQPDWASILVRYRGTRIREAPLLAYLVSYRNHAEFHEQCVERVFMDINEHCRPEALTVYARYTRRGGLDINPFRSNFEDAPENVRLPRQ